MLEEGEILVLGGSWLYFTHMDFLDKEGKVKVKPSIGKGRICLTDRKLLILSAEANNGIVPHETVTIFRNGFFIENENYAYFSVHHFVAMLIL